jgi:hypothetical protein
VVRFASSIASGSWAVTFAPAASSSSIITIAGASRMSSVFGLKARPQTAKCLPLRSGAEVL